MHNYHDVNNALPLGRTLQVGTYRPFSQQARILGFMEQSNIFNTLNFSLSSYDVSNATGAATSVSSFLCPSDTPPQIPPDQILPGFGVGAVNYRANEGTSVAMWFGADDTSNVNNGKVMEPNGLFYSSQLIKLSSITDGTSNTAAFSEHLIGDFSNSISTELSAIPTGPGLTPRTPTRPFSLCPRPT